VNQPDGVDLGSLGGEITHLFPRLTRLSGGAGHAEEQAMRSRP
jgi:hypothetical protein